MMEVGLVGPGRAGRALIGHLPRDAFRLGPVMARRISSARRAVREMKRGTAVDDAESFVHCNVILIAVPDDQIFNAIGRLAVADLDYAGTTALQVSGAREASDLALLEKRGASVGSMLPLQSFGRRPSSLAGVAFLLEGNAKALRVARILVRAWGGEASAVTASEKKRAAIAASIATDVLTAVLHDASQRLRDVGLSRGRAVESLATLATASLEDFSRAGSKARPGPALRGEAKTVQMLMAADPNEGPSGYREALRFAREMMPESNERNSIDSILSPADVRGAGSGR